MAYCVGCGNQVPNEVNFCPTCGKAVEAAPQVAPPQATAPPESYPPQPPAYGQPAPGYYADPQHNKTMGILAYVFLIPLFTGDYKKSPFVKFHTAQAINCYILLAVYGVISLILRMFVRVPFRIAGIYMGWSYFPGWLNILLWLLFIPIVVLVALGVLNAVNEKMQELPVIGKFRFLK